MNKNKGIRYLISVLLILLMVGVAEFTGEKEIVFPELVALVVGLWIIDKRVWKVQRWQIVFLMTIGAVTGVCLVRYSPLPQAMNMTVAFAFAACCLLLGRSSLIPLVSACMLPILLHTEEWIYPVTVLIMSLILVSVQFVMEKAGIRNKTEYVPSVPFRERGIGKWLSMLLVVFAVCGLSRISGMIYAVIPPLVVTFVELATSKAGFRNRPVQVFLFMVFAVFIGTGLQLVGYHYFHLPQTIVALLIVLCLFAIFEFSGKYFAPAGAMAFIPMIVPRDYLSILPFQATLGAALFIAIAMVVYMKCYRWSRAQLIFAFTPSVLRSYIRNRKGRKE